MPRSPTDKDYAETVLREYLARGCKPGDALSISELADLFAENNWKSAELERGIGWLEKSGVAIRRNQRLVLTPKGRDAGAISSSRA